MDEEVDGVDAEVDGVDAEVVEVVGVDEEVVEVVGVDAEVDGVDEEVDGVYEEAVDLVLASVSNHLWHTPGLTKSLIASSVEVLIEESLDTSIVHILFPFQSTSIIVPGISF